MEYKGYIYIAQICFMVGLPISILLYLLVGKQVGPIPIPIFVSAFMIWYVPKHNPIFHELLEKWKEDWKKNNR